VRSFIQNYRQIDGSIRTENPPGFGAKKFRIFGHDESIPIMNQNLDFAAKVLAFGFISSLALLKEKQRLSSRQRKSRLNSPC